MQREEMENVADGKRAPDVGRAVLFADERDGLAVRALAPRGSDLLAVVFSQVRVPAGSFGLSRLFARTAHACLFLNQPENRWYRGVEPLVDAAIDRAREATGARRLVFYGSSMGAWGAAAAAARHPAASALVFAPASRIGEPGSQSAAAGLHPDPDEPDLAALLTGPRSGSIKVVAPLFDPYDAGVAARLAAAGLPEPVRLLPLASTHEVHDHLFSLNLIRRVIAGFTRDLAVEAASRGLLRSVEDWTPYHGLARLASSPTAAADLDALGLDDNPGVALLAAECAVRVGDLADALRRLAELDDRIVADPVLLTLPKRWRKQIPRRRIDLLGRLGRSAEADAVAAAAATRFPEDAGFSPQSRRR